MIRESAPALRKQPGAWQRKWSPMQPDCTTLPLKTCTKCGREYPATLEYFRRGKAGRYGLRSLCKTCDAADDADYRAAHREESAAYKAAYHATHRGETAAYRVEHREEIAASVAAYYAAHREKIAARKAADRAACPEKYAAHNAAARAAYPGKYAARGAVYRAEHLEEYAAYSRNRRALENGNGGKHDAADIRAQYARQKGRCIYCDEKVGKKYHVDHVMPVILCGSNGPENLVIACPACNLSKGAKHPMEFS